MADCPNELCLYNHLHQQVEESIWQVKVMVCVVCMYEINYSNHTRRKMRVGEQGKADNSGIIGGGKYAYFWDL